MIIFLYALKAPESKRQYSRRFKMFLDYLNLNGTIQEQTKQFLVKARIDPQWAQDSLIQFIAYQNERVSSGEISLSNIFKFRLIITWSYYINPHTTFLSRYFFRNS